MTTVDAAFEVCLVEQDDPRVRAGLSTGLRQPEAKALYLATGYAPLFDVAADLESIGPLSFEKSLTQ